MSDHQIELNEKDAFIAKIQSEFKLLKEKFKQKNENSDLIPFYEQQLNHKDQTINVSKLIKND